MQIPQAIIFDAYGTLLDVHSAMQRHAARIGPNWEALSAAWRAKQLEYSWIRSLAIPPDHRDFSQLTDEALHFVAAKHGITDQALLADLRSAYRALHAYPEVPAMLAGLRDRGIQTAILSNGAPAMLAEGVAAAGIDHLLDDVLSVESVGIFKPDPRIYALPSTRFACAPAHMAFVSSNAWDAFGAHTNGYPVIWVNRSAQPDEYDLRSHATEVSDLSTLASLFT